MPNPGTQEFDDKVQEAMLPFLAERFGNPSSIYKAGRTAKAAMDTARAAVARLLEATPEEIFFAPSIDIANDVALLARARALRAGGLPGRFVVAHAGSAALTAAADELKGQGFAVESVTFKGDWRKDLERERAVGACVHVDISKQCQSISYKCARLPADTVALDGKVLCSATDVSVLFVRRGVNLMPIVFGGGQERGLFPGTEPVAAIVGLGRAAELLTA
jgi:cysteine desulfurase